jgi:chromosome segregation ATPase
MLCSMRFGVLLLLLSAICSCALVMPATATLVNSGGYSMDAALSVPSMQVASSLLLAGQDIGQSLNSLQSSLSALSASSVAGLADTLRQMQDMITSHTLSLGSLHAQIDDLKLENAALKANITSNSLSASSSLTILRSEMDDAMLRVEQLTANMSSSQALLASQSAAVASQTAQLLALQSANNSAVQLLSQMLAQGSQTGLLSALSARVFSLETLTGTSTLVTQIVSLNSTSASYATQLSQASANLQQLNASVFLLSTTVGAAQPSGNDHQTRLLNLETIAGTSTLVSDFKAVRDYKVTTSSFYTNISGIITRLINAETLTGGTTLTSTLIALRDLRLVKLRVAVHWRPRPHNSLRRAVHQHDRLE